MKRTYNLIILLVLIISGILWYVFESKTDLITDGSPACEYEIKELVSLVHQTNDSVFNAQHVGKKIQLTGEVKSIDLNLPGAPIFFMTNNETDAVMASFDESIHEKMESVKKGMIVEILCICNGVAKPTDPDDLLSEITYTFNRCNLLSAK